MIKKSNRFPTWLFKRCFGKSTRLRVGDLSFLVSDSRNAPPHFAAVVGKSCTKSAVIRNRLRRQIYEAIRLHLLPVIKNKNIICLYNGEKKEQDMHTLQSWILRFRNHLNIPSSFHKKT